MAERRLSAREVGILLHSKVLDIYPWLCKYLKQDKVFNPDHITMQKKEKKIYRANINHIIEVACAEWALLKQDTESGQGWVKCQLCGNTRNKHMFFIKNLLTGRTINIGSECQKHFDIQNTRPVDVVKKILSFEERRAHITDVLPAIEENIHSWGYLLKSAEYIIPEKLRANLDVEKNSLKKDFNCYVCENEISYGEAIRRMQTERKEAFAAEGEIKRYLKGAVNNSRAVSTGMMNWLKNHRDDIAKRLIKEIEVTGKLGTEADRYSWYLEYPRYMNAQIGRLNTIYNPLNIEFLKVIQDGENYFYRIRINERFPDGIKIDCSHRNVFQQFSGVINGKESILEKDLRSGLLKVSRLSTNNDMNRIIRVLDRKLKGRYILNGKYDNIATNQIAVYDQEINKYAWTTVSQLSSWGFLFAMDVEKEEVVIEQIANRLHKWMTEDDINERLAM